MQGYAEGQHPNAESLILFIREGVAAGLNPEHAKTHSLGHTSAQSLTVHFLQLQVALTT
jgi:hypothetical protein